MKCAVVNLLCYIGAKYHIAITRKLNLFLRNSIKLLQPELLLFGPDMHQIVCRLGLGLCPRPHWEAYSAPPDPLAGLRGPTSKGRGREGTGGEREGEGEGGGGEGEREGVKVLDAHQYFRCLI